MAVVPAPQPHAEPGLPGPDAFRWTAALRERRQAAGHPGITGLVHTRNEERFVATALASLGWVDELIVVDMESDDGTVAIAEAADARIIEFENVGYVEPARAFGLAQAETPWILLLDADEWIDEPLAEALAEIAAQDAADVLDLPFRSYLCGAWLKGTGWAGESHPRFFKAGFVDWPAHVHAEPRLSGRVLRLGRAPGLEVNHWNYDDLHEFVDKLNRYTGREAERIETLSFADAVAAARSEVERRWTPELDGTRSVALSLAMASYRLMAHAKAWERHGFPDIGAPATAREALKALAVDDHAAGIAAYEQGDLAGASRHLGHAVDREALNDLAVVEAARGNRDTAIALLQACLVLDPNHTDARANLDALVPHVPQVIAEALPDLGRRLAALTGLEHVDTLYLPGPIVEVPVLELGRPLALRPGTSDVRVLDDTFDGRYHLPPADVGEPKLVVDLGSNIGTTLAHFAALWPEARIVGVELDAENAELARLNAGPTCTILQGAVAGSGGTRSYTPSDGREWGYAAADRGTVTVPALTIDHVLAEAAPGQTVDYLKVDIEGAEAEVFRAGGDWVEHIRVLKCEIHPPYTVEEAVRDLTALGFAVAVDGHHFSCVIARR